MRKWDFIAKVVMIGDSGCGKSSLTIRLTDDRFSDIHDVTIAAEIGSKIIPVGEDQNIKLQIWDTAGQEHFRAVTKSYFRNAAGCLLVYDVTRKQTLRSAQGWLADVRELADDNMTICLVGNKCDLESERQVTTEEAQQWAQENGIEHFVETSAKTGDNVVQAYSEVAEQIHQKIVAGRYDLNKNQGIKANQGNNSAMINLNLESQKQQSRCC